MSSAAQVTSLVRRRQEPLTLLLIAGAALVFGAIVAKQPFIAVGVLGVGFVVALAFLTPVLHLVLLIAVTAVVPYGLQNRFGVGGGPGSPGLLVSDLLLLTAFLRAACVLLQQRLDRRQARSLFVVIAFLALATAQFFHGASEGRPISVAGAELRALLGFGVLLVALPVVCDAAQRARLARALPAVGLIVGLWGIAQWALQIPFSVAGDVGVREGVGLTTAGKGQIQGALFAFPVAIVMAVAALTSLRELSWPMRVVLYAVVVLNSVSLLLTYERTFWIATVLGCVFVVLRARPGERARAVVTGCLAVGALLALLSTFAPGELATARERFLSLGQYGQDNSVRYRLTESRVVLEQIDDRPLVGSGLAATIFWGRPYEQVPPESYTYSHNGYLWLAWKLGLPGALLLIGAILLAITRGGTPIGGSLSRALRNGAKGTLIALLLASVTFPSFSGQGITPTMGLLLAICALPVAPGAYRRPPARMPAAATVRGDLALARSPR